MDKLGLTFLEVIEICLCLNLLVVESLSEDSELIIQHVDLVDLVIELLKQSIVLLCWHLSVFLHRLVNRTSPDFDN